MGFLSEVEARAEQATDAEWAWGDWYDGDRSLGSWDGQTYEPFLIPNAEDRQAGPHLDISEGDKEFIASARSDIPRLCALVRTLGEALAGLEHEMTGSAEHDALAAYRAALGA